jgi:hypothetical protein
VNTVTIDYFPKIFASCNEDAPISAADYTYIKDRVVAGFKMWEGNYTVYGEAVDVKVNVNPTRVSSFDAANILIDTDGTSSWIDRSLVPTTIFWNRSTGPQIWFNLVSEYANSQNNLGYVNTETQEFVDPITHTAMHEFGHVLGLFDAYDDVPYAWIDALPNRANPDDVMFNLNDQIVYDYNVAMMLHAFRDNSLQNYGNKALLGVESEVYFRVTSLI